MKSININASAKVKIQGHIVKVVRFLEFVAVLGSVSEAEI
jgi:hypothetical protein